MRILFITPLYEPAGRAGGGVVSCLAALCGGLVSVGMDVTVYTTNASGAARALNVPLGTRVLQKGVPVYYFRSTFGSNSTFDSRGLIHRLEETVKEFDVVYIAALWQWTGISAAHICFRHKKPVIMGIHGGFAGRLMKKSYLRKQCFRLLFLQNVLRRVSAIHLTSNNELKAAGGLLDGFRAITVPNAVDGTLLYPVDSEGMLFRKRHDIAPEAPILISVGRPDWLKRIDLLVKAISCAPKWHLVFVGDDSTGRAPQWKALAEEIGASRRITWTGFLDRADLRAALSAADLFALVSENENFGMAVVEAMLCGLPVMISPDVGVADYLQGQPFATVVARDEHEIAGILGRFKKDDQVGRDVIRATACHFFSPDVVARQFMAAVGSAVDGNGPQGGG